MSEQYTFKIYKDPYDTGSMYHKNVITFNKGFTALVGCNGSGKTTLLEMIKDICESKKLPFLDFDNLHDGGNTKIQMFLMSGMIDNLADMCLSSEGEKISKNLTYFFGKIKNAAEKCTSENNNLFIFFDATDSGMSIDNIMELKDAIQLVIDDQAKNNIDVYFIVSANSYEMANGEQCFDVVKGEYLTFGSYKEYKKFILNSRHKKDIRNERFLRNAAKKEQEEEKRKQEEEKRKQEEKDYSNFHREWRRRE